MNTCGKAKKGRGKNKLSPLPPKTDLGKKKGGEEKLVRNVLEPEKGGGNKKKGTHNKLFF